MEEERISFETAKLAKEKGFNWGCNKIFNIPTKMLLDAWEFCPDGNYKNFLEDKINYAAPTQSLLQKWLRVEKYIDVLIIPAIKENHYEWLIMDSNENRIECEECFVSYEEALETGLQKALKLI